jgi:hypothetical protein
LSASGQRVLLAALAGLTIARAANGEESVPPPEFPTTVFADGARTAAVAVGDLTSTITMVRRPQVDPTADVPVLSVAVGGAVVLEAVGVGSGFNVPLAEASIAEIDPDNRQREVFFSSYSGGAHCCNSVVVVTDVAGRWTAVPVGDFDGDGDLLHDIDKDGRAEIVTVDNRFLYRFDCYACSAAPLVVYAVTGGTVVDVSAEPRYATAQRHWLAQIEDTVDPAQRWSSPGYLAGWVAQKVRVGEGAAAWAALEAHWDLARDAGEEVCLTGAPLDACPSRERKVMKFPQRLKLFLDETGYRF